MATLLECLHEAIRQQDHASCSTWLRQGPDINAVHRRVTAVTLAAAVGHWPIWQLMLDHPDFRPDAPDQLGYTPLHEAALHGQTEVVRSLLIQGATVDSLNLRGRAPLAAAAYGGNVEVAELLISHGADVNAVDKKGMTPLSIAASNLNVGVVDVLLRHGADANGRAVARGTIVESPLVETVLPAALLPNWKKREDVMKILQKLIDHGCDLEAANGAGDTALHRAVLSRQFGPACLLMSSGCQLEKRNRRGCTPLHEALGQGDLEMARLLLQYGSDANALCEDLAGQDNPTGLPLLAALFAPEGEFPVLKFLPHILVVTDVSGPVGADVLQRIEDSTRLEKTTQEEVQSAVEGARQTYLKWACVRTIRSLVVGRMTRGTCLLDHLETFPLPKSLKRLLAANANSLDNPLTACDLHLAVALGDTRRISEILGKGFNPDACVDCQTPLMMAITHKPLQRSAHVNPTDTHTGDDFRVFDLLVKNEANVKGSTKPGMTSLHVAAAEGREDVVDWLLKKGSDVTAQTQDGKTAADMAAEGLYFSVALKLLLPMPKPLVNHVPIRGLPILHWAAAAGDADAVDRLLELGVRADLLDVFGSSALHVAASAGSLYQGLTPEQLARLRVPREKLERLGARRNHEVFLKAARLLVAKGCPAGLVNQSQDTPLSLAQRIGFKDMTLLLKRVSPP